MLGLGLGVSHGQRVHRTTADPSLTSPYRLVLWRGQMPQALESAGQHGSLSEVVHITQLIAPLRIAPVFSNSVVFATAPYGEVDNGTGDIKIRFSWERDLTGTTGTVVQGTFSGADQGTCAGGSFLIGDFIEGSAWSADGGVVGGRWPASTVFSFKTEVIGATPGTTRWPIGMTKTTTYTNTGGLTGSRADLNGQGSTTNLGSRVYAQGAIDLTSLSARTQQYAPIGYIGQYADGDNGYAAIMWMGDSISDTYSGANQINWAGLTTDVTGNFVTRALRASKQSGCQASLASSAQIRGYTVNAKMRKAMMPYCSQILLQDCTNDILFGSLATDLYSNVKLIVQDALARGVKGIYGLSAIPRVSSSSDNFLTTTNQVIQSADFDYGGQADLYRQLLANGAGSVTGVDQYIDINLAVSHASSRFLWDVNGVNSFPWTLDGTHPRGTGGGPAPNGVQRMQNALAVYMNTWTL